MCITLPRMRWVGVVIMKARKEEEGSEGVAPRDQGHDSRTMAGENLEGRIGACVPVAVNAGDQRRELVCDCSR